jgi:thiol-disulfide isomerase/thioredoxin
MLAGIAIRAGLAILLAAAGFGAWKLLGLAALVRARRAGEEIAGAPAGFVRGRPGLLVFGSPRCAPCVHAQRPAVRRLEKELEGAIQLIEVDVTEDPLAAQRYGVVSLPTVFVFDSRGKPRRVNHGLVPLDELRRQISPFLVS